MSKLLLLCMVFSGVCVFADNYPVNDFMMEDSVKHIVFHDSYLIEGVVVPIGSHFVITSMTSVGDENVYNMTLSGEMGTLVIKCEYKKAKLMSVLHVGNPKMNCPYTFKLLKDKN